MSAFRAAHATAGSWTEACKACVEQLGELDEAFNLGFIYVTDALAPELAGILGFLRESTPIEDWAGAAGFGVCASGREYVETPAMALMAAALPSDAYRVFSTIDESFEEFRVDHRDWVERSQPIFAVVHGDSQNGKTPEIIARMAEETSAFLVGGLVSASGPRNQIAGEVTGGGVSGVMFSGRVAVATGLSQGCAPVGPAHKITDARGNVLISLDNRNALEVFKEDIGEALSQNLRRVGGHIHAALPVPGSDTGDYVVRNLVGIDPDKGWLAIGEYVEPGGTVTFCARGRPSAERDLKRMLSELKARIEGAPKGGVYFSCVARGPNLFGANSEELGMIREELGAFPLAGFYANGEISHNRLYGYTGVLALFL